MRRPGLTLIPLLKWLSEAVKAM